MDIYKFDCSEAQLSELAQETVRLAKKAGADEAQASAGESFSLSVGVRSGEQETCEFGQDRSASISVRRGMRSGSASCGSLDMRDIKSAIDRALAMAEHAEDDECAGLPEQQELAKDHDASKLSLHHPWRPTVEQARNLALACEQAAFDADKRISRSKSEGAEATTDESRGAMANSLGFVHAQTSSMHSISCNAIADCKDGKFTAGWHSEEREFAKLDDPASVGRRAGERAAAKDNGREAKTAKVPALFEAGCAHSLLFSIIGAASGGNQFRKLSYLRGKAGEQVCTSRISIHEDPFVPGGKRTRSCDAEGVAVRARDIVADGVLTGYLLSSYSARKLGLKTTGNAGGAHNLQVRYQPEPLEKLMRDLGTGIFITGLMGRGVNIVTGDYSYGVTAFWVQDGKIAYPINKATIAGNLEQTLNGIIAGGDDVLERNGMVCGSLLVDEVALGAEG